MNSRIHFCFKRIHILNDSVAADVSIVTAAAYSTLGVTTAAISEAAATDVLQLRHLPIFLQQRQRPLISLSLLILRQRLLQERQ
jgi:hypothetical protein